MLAVHSKPRGYGYLPGAVVLAAVLAAASAANAQDSAFKLGIGADFTTGDYGTGQTVNIRQVPVTANYETGRWILGLKIPFISITSTGEVVGGTDGPIVTRKKKAARSTESGLGDIVASAGYAVLSGNAGMLLLDVSGLIKIPTASEGDGLGTGEFDYTAQLDLSREFGKFTPFGTLGYRFIGEPSGTDLDNIFFASLGAAFAFNRRFSTGLALDYSQATTSGTDEALEVSPFFAWNVTKRWGLNIYGLIGLSDGSPDSGGGVEVTATF